MATENKRVRIPIEDGIFTFGTGYEVGTRLRASLNFIHKYIPMQAGKAVDFVDQNWWPMRAEAAPTVFDEGGSITCAERFENTEISGNANQLFGGTDDNNQHGIWNETGTKVAGINTSGSIKSIAHWSSLSTPTTFVTAPTMIMLQTTDRSTFTQYVPVGLGVSAKVLLVYQNRLWLAVNNKTYFTDILNPNNIRQFGQTNPIITPMDITVLERIGVSDIDPGAQSHLFMGGATQCWVLDGSPGAGNQVLRRYASQNGVLKEQHCVSTNLGLVYFGTDRQLYLVQPGAVGEPQAVGGSIRDLLKTGEVSLAWRKPYLMVFIGDIASVLYIDVSQDQIKWWGSIEATGDFEPGPVSSRFPALDYFWISSRDPNAVPFTAFVHLVSDPYQTTETGIQKLRTGFLFEPGHEVALRKVHCTMRPGLNTKVFTVKCFSNQAGQGYSKTFTVPGGNGPITNYSIPVNAIVGANNTRGEYIYLELSCTNKDSLTDAGMAMLQNWEVEYDVIKRMKI